MDNIAILQKGTLGNMYECAISRLIYKIAPQTHADAYIGAHGDWFAESEFAGKYLDTCVRTAITDPDNNRAQKALENARIVVRAIIENQRADGYIGGLCEGGEKRCFSVWNQAFTMIGLCSFAEAFPEDPLAAPAVEAARRIACYNASIFCSDRSILEGINNGSQHLSLLLGLVRLLRLTPDPEVRRFTEHIVDCIKSSDNNFFGFESILDLRSKKGIENFVILIGMLEYGELFGDDGALSACVRYWDELEKTQIRPNGNGTLHEVWTEGGNEPRFLGLGMNPDENCVAVGWIELSLALYYRLGDKKYIDAVERAVFNHLLGALSDDGSDFAYYQPNFGHRITKTDASMYKCCRYRGYSAVSILPYMIFHRRGESIETLLYSDARYDDGDIELIEHSEFPYGSEASLEITNKTHNVKALRLRVPAEARLDAKLVDCSVGTVGDGFIELALDELPGQFTLRLDFDVETKLMEAVIDGQKYVLGKHGCILLAAETDCPEPEPSDTLNQNTAAVSDYYFERLSALSVSPDAQPVPIRANDSRLAYRVGELVFKDFASAGRQQGKAFTVYVRCG